MNGRPRSELDEAARRLIDHAIAARAHAYAPYSGFEVGAAVRAADGTIFSGCNVEISSYGLTVCAERVALFSAYAAGVREIEAVAVAGPPGSGAPTPPCGACRQVIWDLAPSADIYLASGSDEVETHAAADLLPFAFGPAELARRGSDSGREEIPE